MKNIKNEQGGFLQLILLVVVVLFLMKYFGVSFSDVYNWLKDLLDSVLK